MKKLYIAYGSNLNIRQMAMRCPTARIAGKSELNGYELQFKGSPYSAYATITPCKNSRIPVLVWEVKRADERALDLYEGYPSHYIKQNLNVLIGDHYTNAMAYIMTDGRDFGIPSHHYYNTVLEGYVKAGFDTQILNDAVDKSIEEYRKIEACHVMQTDMFDDEISDEDEEVENDYDLVVDEQMCDEESDDLNQMKF